MIQQREGSMEGSTIREAVAVFDDPERLESAVSALQSAGIDRSELSILAHTSLLIWSGAATSESILNRPLSGATTFRAVAASSCFTARSLSRSPSRISARARLIEGCRLAK